MSDALSAKAFLDLFLWWAEEFDAAERFYANLPQQPGSLAPVDYDWTHATEAADRLLAHVPETSAEAVCLIEVLIDQLDDRIELISAMRALQTFLGQQSLGDRLARAPDRAIVTYASKAA